MPHLVLPRKAIEKYSKIKDPAEYIETIRKQIDVDKIEISLNRILCAVYITYERMAGSGLFKAPDTQAEDIFQGRAALVLKVGPTAFVDGGPGGYSFYGFKVEPGDWVTFKIGNGTQMEIQDVPCRLVSDHWIEMKVPDPRMLTS